jgi:hypothetical protein
MIKKNDLNGSSSARVPQGSRFKMESSSQFLPGDTSWLIPDSLPATGNYPGTEVFR